MSEDANIYRRASEVAHAIPRWATPRNRCIDGGFIKRKLYRGREQYVAGYSWHRLHSHHLSGIVYDCILGAGGTREEALAKMTERVQLMIYASVGDAKKRGG